MRILILSNMYPSRKDQVYGTFVREFTESIRIKNNPGKTVLVAIKGRTNNPFKKLFKYLVFYLDSLFRLVFCNYDIVYVHTVAYPIIPIKIVSCFKELPLVFNVHGGDLKGTGKAVSRLRAVAKPILYKSLAIISPSQYFKGEIAGFLPDYPKDKIFVSASGGVNTKLFCPAERKTKADTFVLGFVSRIDIGKGWDLFLGAIADLFQHGIPVRGIIAGRGQQLPQMLEMIKSLGLESIVEYVGPVPHDDLPETFRKFDVFVFPTIVEESLGLVGIEAMACGVPVIASDSHGPTDYIVNNKNGLMFRTGDQGDLVKKITGFYNLSEEDNLDFSMNACMTALEYDTDKVMSTLYEYLYSLVSEK